jgi:hypothetical protein
LQLLDCRFHEEKTDWKNKVRVDENCAQDVLTEEQFEQLEELPFNLREPSYEARSVAICNLLKNRNMDQVG